ncbi:MAG: hypothetical protein DMG57_23130 [Acidobacteria bacterium]|nr:MAG: hypothetical protein DMG57_23130 [Acidobacteriota bacterium]
MPDFLGQGLRAHFAAKTLKRPALLLLVAAGLCAGSSLDWVDELGGRTERNATGDVTAVHLAGTWVTDTELLDIVRLPKLERLDLAHTRISDEGLQYCKPAKQMKELNLFYAEQITDRGITAIKDWKKLTSLNLHGTRISDGALEILGGLPQLEVLDIAYTPFTDNGLDALVPLTALRQLSIGRSKLSQNAIEVLRLFPTLEYLDVGGPHPGPGGYRATSGLPMDDNLPRAISGLKQLRVLKLSYSQIAADGLSTLVALDQVNKLSLLGCPRVDDRALAALAKWKSLKYVDVQETGTTQEGIEALKKARPEIQILCGPLPPTHPLSAEEPKPVR